MGIGLLIVVASALKVALSQFFPGFQPVEFTIILSFSIAIIVGLIAAVFPITRALRMSIVDGLRVVD